MTPTILAGLTTIVFLMASAAALVTLGWWFDTTYGGDK